MVDYREILRLTCLNKKLDDKNFIAQYGAETVFSYGCNPEGEKMMYGNDDTGAFAVPVKVPQSDFYVYRMTMTNEDGDVVEYTPDFMRYRCEQMGVKTVPLLWSGNIPTKYERYFDLGTGEEYEMTPGDWIKEKAEEFYDGPDPVGTHHSVFSRRKSLKVPKHLPQTQLSVSGS